MKRAVLVSVGALMAVLAMPALVMPALVMAHPSVVPHQHPHEASMLPDLGAVLLAALLVGLGVFALRRLRRE